MLGKTRYFQKSVSVELICTGGKNRVFFFKSVPGKKTLLPVWQFIESWQLAHSKKIIAAHPVAGTWCEDDSLSWCWGWLCQVPCWEPQIQPLKKRQRRMTYACCMDESGQGPKRAVAEAVAHPLKTQPGIHNNTKETSSKRSVARVWCSHKSIALRLVLWQCSKP
jgi:hypothetical protein